METSLMNYYRPLLQDWITRRIRYKASASIPKLDLYRAFVADMEKLEIAPPSMRAFFPLFTELCPRALFKQHPRPRRFFGIELVDADITAVRVAPQEQ
jgi:hypothetical protein